ncbi:MAG: hypothetical protein A3D96_04825 [Chlamydiae bacterium RIFCSPHIGHO2_12_FULL_44_59]|nr:MAG: hypothetical protein A2796_01755 [Chlamydiae bacterium RIFCSPHIGHO2_01_FULL_44_39]OGN58186.1 MAG: hypothetical protein A3C42_06445 [Chlamydiae bacterium RIFCSPHIGHO2_02_FULL_45_9]OGN61074.1 MAG: hypothetical protein A3D96_04825 [Chlamydiae bacterium RIFCSPHIGHO2_12_FULL_44_59]OGN66880.1 MAG: hypothetical protein A2978_01765 [Chlamydiae bacterium RIFCSPLOWO2_01_FULL_44_52]OGN68903.1 MAG: hypothetical protein A3F79_04020 [Chlamydiae bacterium RIFCSPLOWO2_12_FULL_45_20]OGN70097.1 MAG: hyp
MFTALNTVTLRTMQDSYVRKFPAEVPIKAAQGFIATTVIHLLLGSASSLALLGGTIAAVATIIEAITRPIINTIFPEHKVIAQCIQIVMPKMMALGLASSRIPWLDTTTSTVTFLLVNLIAWPTLNYRFYERNVAMVEIV